MTLCDKTNHPLPEQTQSLITRHYSPSGTNHTPFREVLMNSLFTFNLWCQSRRRADQSAKTIFERNEFMTTVEGFFGGLSVGLLVAAGVGFWERSRGLDALLQHTNTAVDQYEKDRADLLQDAKASAANPQAVNDKFAIAGKGLVAVTIKGENCFIRFPDYMPFRPNTDDKGQPVVYGISNLACVPK